MDEYTAKVPNPQSSTYLGMTRQLNAGKESHNAEYRHINREEQKPRRSPSSLFDPPTPPVDNHYPQ